MIRRSGPPPKPAQPTLGCYRGMVERWLGHAVEGRVQTVTLNRGWLHNVPAGDTARAIEAYERQRASA